ncbi:MAG: hypothetical protein WAV13_08910 [Thermodesulfovibrionales bacterium]
MQKWNPPSSPLPTGPIVPMRITATCAILQDYNFEFIYQWGSFGNGDIRATRKRSEPSGTPVLSKGLGSPGQAGR